MTRRGSRKRSRGDREVIDKGVKLSRRRVRTKRIDEEAERRWRRMSEELQWLRRWDRQQLQIEKVLDEDLLASEPQAEGNKERSAQTAEAHETSMESCETSPSFSPITVSGRDLEEEQTRKEKVESNNERHSQKL